MNILKSSIKKANKIKTQPVDLWFFFGFLLTFCFSVRKVMLYFPIQGTFNEYTGIYLYVSDIFLILTIGSWLFILLSTKIDLLSSKFQGNDSKWQIMAYIKQNTTMHKLWIRKFMHNLYLLLPLIFVALSFISISWSDNTNIAFFRSIKLLELYLLYIYIIFRIVPPACRQAGVEQSRKCSTWNIFGGIIIFLGLFQSIMAILQVISQHSVGLRFLRESIISPNVPGVAKIVLDGEKYIRAYGIFPHPNVLGGFLLFSIIITWMYCKLFHVEQFYTASPNGNQNCSTWNNKEIFIKFILWIQMIALFLSFSKSAIIALIISVFYTVVSLKNKNFLGINSNPAFSSQKSSHIQRHPWKIFGENVDSLPCRQAGQTGIPNKFLFFNKIIILSLLILIMSFFLFLKPGLNSIFIQSLSERSLYLNVPRGTFMSDPVFGLGMGQFVPSMQQFFNQKLLSWQFQPIHNVFLSIFSELGLVGAGIFIWWLYDIFLRKKKGEYILCNNNTNMSIEIIMLYFKGILLGFIFIMLFDHYLWDIWPGQVLLWIVLGIVAGIKRKC